MPNPVAGQIVEAMTTRGLHLAIAESLTGGALAAAVVDVPGASKMFLGSIVAYDTSLKSSLLGVDEALLAKVGAVDSQVAAQMAEGARLRLATAAKVSKAATVGLACTGVAGPDSQDGKPVGTVFIAVDTPGGALVREFLVPGDRAKIRNSTIGSALNLLAEVLGL
jgi:nicotinamide-nucleotide amidase